MGMGKNIKLALGTIIFSALLFAGCSNNENQYTDAESIDLTLSDGDSEALVTRPQQWHITNKRILVLFGYGFNDSQTIESISDTLKNRYGLDSDGGLIYSLTYPEDFKHGIKGYASELYSRLQSDDLDLAGVILLGAPENTHVAIARNQDKWNQEVPYPVIALFPQDDVLGLESTCDIVIDKGQTSSISGDINEEEDNQLITEAPEVLTETIDYIQTLSYSLTKDSKLQTHVLQMLKNHNIHHYVDPETGLQSINHFVIN